MLLIFGGGQCQCSIPLIDPKRLAPSHRTVPQELQVEAYSSDVCIGKGTVILSELDDEDGQDPIVEVQLFQIFLHHRCVSPKAQRPEGSARPEAECSLVSTHFQGSRLHPMVMFYKSKVASKFFDAQQSR